ncbi:MAG TPA: ATP-dependent zinc metalloprotease FtsH [Thermoanaerobaculia bacterium]|nr:ATP-dependent zinc metalloprotease FtsH [Thermoanaerobaculia bacterium]
MSSTLRTLLLWAIVFVMVILLINFLQQGRTAGKDISFSEFLTLVQQEKVSQVTIRGDRLTGEFKPGISPDRNDEFVTQLPQWDGLVDLLRQKRVEIYAEPQRDSPLLTMLFSWGPILLIIGLWIFFMRQMQTGGNRALSFGKSKAKLLSTSGKKVTFKDVAGVEEAKEELSEIVDYLKDPQRFQKLGGKIPKGVLLMGPPGTGKTLLARAIAGEANVPFFSISGSDFVEMFVGVGASRVRDLFEQGKKNAPCIIFIDEIDAVGRHRGAGLGGGHDEREQTLNQLLVEMDGFETNEGVILIAATNRPDVLDPALLRPGRFDRRVVVDRPDIAGRLGILQVHSRTVPLDDDVDLEVIARGTPGFAGADLANLVNEAALIAARRNQKSVDMASFEYAKDKVLMGAERKSMVLTEEEKKITAYHEAGHAVVAAFLPRADPLHKITIIPRGRALGLTMQLPTEDKYTYKKTYVLAQIAILMGGRVAEELTQEDITTGAGNDIERATDLARQMVCEWGMSELGPLSFGEKSEPIFLGRDFAQRADFSPDTAIKIDQQVSRIVTEGHETATQILTEHRDVLEQVAQDLLEHESLDGKHVYDVIEKLTGQDLRPKRHPIVMPKPAVPEPVPATEEEPEEERVSASETVGRRAREAAEKAVRGRDQDEVEDDEASPEVVAAQRNTHRATDTELPARKGLQGSKGSR